MNVISLFDGISCAYVALQKANIPIQSYIAYEIDNHATTISRLRHPSIQHKGDVKQLLHKVPCDILIGGSPCTDLSMAKKDRQGLEGNHSSLFWEYVRILRLLQPTFFILENVACMPTKDKDCITKELGVEPILFDSSLVSAQRRRRLFWTNIPFTLPADKGITFSMIKEPFVDEKYFTKHTYPSTECLVVSMIGRRIKDGKRCDNDMTVECKQRIAPKLNPYKTGALTGVAKDNLIAEGGRVRRLTPIECERLMGLSDGYTEGVSDTQRCRLIGNAFHCDVVAHILNRIKKP